MTRRIPGWLEALARQLECLSRASKRAVAVAADALALPLLLATALVLKYDSLIPVAEAPLGLYVAASLIGVAVLAAFGAYREVFRYISLKGLVGGWFGVPVATLSLAIVDVLLFGVSMSLSVYASYGVLVLLYLSGSRVILRSGEQTRILDQLALTLTEQAHLLHTKAHVARDLREDGAPLVVGALLNGLGVEVRGLDRVPGQNEVPL